MDALRNWRCRYAENCNKSELIKFTTLFFFLVFMVLVVVVAGVIVAQKRKRETANLWLPEGYKLHKKMRRESPESSNDLNLKNMSSRTDLNQQTPFLPKEYDDPKGQKYIALLN